MRLHAQEPQRSASRAQAQQEDRGDMPMALMQELAGTLGELDETGMNGVRLASPTISFCSRSLFICIGRPLQAADAPPTPLMYHCAPYTLIASCSSHPLHAADAAPPLLLIILPLTSVLHYGALSPCKLLISPRPLLLIIAPPVFVLHCAPVTPCMLLVPQHPELDKSGMNHAHGIKDQDIKWDLSLPG